MKGKKILIVTYYWPPSSGVGVQRWMNYSIQLKKLGWEPIIYTPENPQFELKDPSLLEKVRDIRVVKTKIWEPFNFFHRLTGNRNKQSVQQGIVLEKGNSSFKDRLFIRIRGNFFVPDPRKYWVKPSVKFLCKFIQEEGIETMITTGPPHSMHLIGRGVKRKLNIKWLADFRDPWSEWDVLKKLKTSPFMMKKHRRLEKSVLKEADSIITVSKPLVEHFKNLGARKFDLLYNGVSVDTLVEKPTSDRLVIGHFGLLNELRNPTELWKLLDEIAEDLNIELRLGGIVSASITQEIDDLPVLSNRVHYLNYLTHEEVMEEYKKCDLLLLLQNRTENANSLVPLKFFELLAASRWVLSLGPSDNEIASLASTLPSFKLLPHTDSESIREFLLIAKSEQPNLEGAKKLVEEFRHDHLVTTLQLILNQ